MRSVPYWEMTSSLLVLVPPSEAKTPGGTKRTSVGPFDDALQGERQRVVAALEFVKD